MINDGLGERGFTAEQIDYMATGRLLERGWIVVHGDNSGYPTEVCRAFVSLAGECEDCETREAYSDAALAPMPAERTPGFVTWTNHSSLTFTICIDHMRVDDFNFWMEEEPRLPSR